MPTVINHKSLRNDSNNRKDKEEGNGMIYAAVSTYFQCGLQLEGSNEFMEIWGFRNLFFSAQRNGIILSSPGFHFALLCIRVIPSCYSPNG